MSFRQGRMCLLATGTLHTLVTGTLSTCTTCRAISLDPEVYPDPEAFKPERWLNDRGEMREDLKFCNWGFGRRYDSSFN